MDHRQLSNLLIKIAGIVVIIFTVAAIPEHINSFLYQGQDTLSNFVVWVIIPLLAPIIIGLLMWSFPRTITNKIFEKEIEPAGSNRAVEEIERIAVTVRVHQPLYIDGSVVLSAFVARRASQGMVVPFIRSTTQPGKQTEQPFGRPCGIPPRRYSPYQGNNHCSRAVP